MGAALEKAKKDPKKPPQKKKKSYDILLNSKYCASSQTYKVLNEGKYVSLQEGFHYYAKISNFNLSSGFPPKNLQTFQSMCWAKDDDKTFQYTEYLSYLV